MGLERMLLACFRGSTPSHICADENHRTQEKPATGELASLGVTHSRSLEGKPGQSANTPVPGPLGATSTSVRKLRGVASAVEAAQGDTRNMAPASHPADGQGLPSGLAASAEPPPCPDRAALATRAITGPSPSVAASSASASAVAVAAAAALPDAAAPRSCTLAVVTFDFRRPDGEPRSTSTQFLLEDAEATSVLSSRLESQRLLQLQPPNQLHTQTQQHRISHPHPQQQQQHPHPSLFSSLGMPPVGGPCSKDDPGMPGDYTAGAGAGAGTGGRRPSDDPHRHQAHRPLVHPRSTDSGPGLAPTGSSSGAPRMLKPGPKSAVTDAAQRLGSALRSALLRTPGTPLDLTGHGTAAAASSGGGGGLRAASAPMGPTHGPTSFPEGFHPSPAAAEGCGGAGGDPVTATASGCGSCSAVTTARLPGLPSTTTFPLTSRNTSMLGADGHTATTPSFDPGSATRSQMLSASGALGSQMPSWLSAAGGDAAAGGGLGCVGNTAGGGHMPSSGPEPPREIGLIRPSSLSELSCELEWLRWLASGSGGSVYTGLWKGSPVAVKVMLSCTPDQLRESTREALLSRVVSHPAICQCFTVCTECIGPEHLRLPQHSAAAGQHHHHHHHHHAHAAAGIASPMSATDIYSSNSCSRMNLRLGPGRSPHCSAGGTRPSGGRPWLPPGSGSEQSAGGGGGSSSRRSVGRALSLYPCPPPATFMMGVPNTGVPSSVSASALASGAGGSPGGAGNAGGSDRSSGGSAARGGPAAAVHPAMAGCVYDSGVRTMEGGGGATARAAAAGEAAGTASGRDDGTPSGFPPRGTATGLSGCGECPSGAKEPRGTGHMPPQQLRVGSEGPGDIPVRLGDDADGEAQPPTPPARPGLLACTRDSGKSHGPIGPGSADGYSAVATGVAPSPSAPAPAAPAAFAASCLQHHHRKDEGPGMPAPEPPSGSEVATAAAPGSHPPPPCGSQHQGHVYRGRTGKNVAASQGRLDRVSDGVGDGGGVSGTAPLMVTLSGSQLAVPSLGSLRPRGSGVGSCGDSGPAVQSLAFSPSACGGGVREPRRGGGGTAGPAGGTVELNTTLSLSELLRTQPATEDDYASSLHSLPAVLLSMGATPGKFCTVVVLEWCNQGTLLQAIRSRPFNPERSADNQMGLLALLRTALEVAQGMSYLHSLDIIHGDLKPSNVLLQSHAGSVGNNNIWAADLRGYVAKVADFGLAVPAQSSSAGGMLVPPGAGAEAGADGANWGALAYLAPEVPQSGPSKKSDVYSYGCVLYSMCTGKQPFEGIRTGRLLLGLATGQLTLQWPDRVYKLLRRLGEACCASTPRDRPSFDKVVSALQRIIAHVASARSPGGSCSSRLSSRVAQETSLGSSGAPAGASSSGPPAGAAATSASAAAAAREAEEAAAAVAAWQSSLAGCAQLGGLELFAKLPSSVPPLNRELKAPSRQ